MYSEREFARQAQWRRGRSGRSNIWSVRETGAVAEHVYRLQAGECERARDGQDAVGDKPSSAKGSEIINGAAPHEEELGPQPVG